MLLSIEAASVVSGSASNAPIIAPESVADGIVPAKG